MISYLYNCRLTNFKVNKYKLDGDIFYTDLSGEFKKGIFVKWNAEKDTKIYQDGFYNASGLFNDYQGINQLTLSQEPILIPEGSVNIPAFFTEKVIESFSPIKVDHKKIKESYYSVILQLPAMFQNFVNWTYAAVELDWSDGWRNLEKMPVLPEKGKGLQGWGAVYYHHAYDSGLIMHSLEVSNGAGELCIVNGFSEREIIFARAGGLIHDIGKYIEYEKNGLTSSRSGIGKIHEGHIGLGCRFLERVWNIMEQHPENISRNDLEKLCHIIESHHGAEFGICDPRSAAAVAVRFADETSAKGKRISDYFSQNKDKEFYQYNNTQNFFKS